MPAKGRWDLSRVQMVKITRTL